jgi:PAS domain S-box-containing protein
MRAALVTPWDIILADYNMPEFSAPAALKIAQELSLDIPFLIISGGIGEDIAVECMKAGAHDYLMKGSLARLVPAVERELRETEVRAARRDAEQSLRESELRYRLLWETCPDAVLLMNTGGTIQFANPAVEEIFGYKPVELLGRNISLLQPEAMRERHTQGVINYVRTGIKHTHWIARESTGRRKDGQEIVIEISSSDMVLQGERRFVGFIRDITERKKNEETLRARDQEMQVAREIQQALFPRQAPELSLFDISGASYPADATGGDYYDYLPMLGDRLGVVVADVTGHGFGPAMLMAETRAYLRILTHNREEMGEILTLANNTLAEDVGSERFVTLLLARLDPVRRTMVYASAGHPACYLFDSHGVLKQTLKRTGPPLGIQVGKSFTPSPEIPFAPGDLLLLVTDGIEEAVGPGNEFYGTDRILQFIAENHQLTASEVVRGLYKNVRQFSGEAPQLDDLTAVVVKIR